MFENIKLSPPKTFNRVRETTKETNYAFTKFVKARTSKRQPRTYAEYKAMPSAEAAAKTR